MFFGFLCFLVFGSCCVFFFKQKTAYEVRISDWSSDVCSSDLWRDLFLRLLASVPGLAVISFLLERTGLGWGWSTGACPQAPSTRRSENWRRRSWPTADRKSVV